MKTSKIIKPVNFTSLELELIEEFQKKFYEVSGYIPTVLPPDYKIIDDETIISLEDLYRLIETHEPYKYGKKISLKSRNRCREIVDLRIIFAFLAHSMGYKLKNIGKVLGNKHHSSIIHYVKTFNDIIETSEPFKQLFNKIFYSIKTNFDKHDKLSALVNIGQVWDESQPIVLPGLLQEQT